jgi:hypothetical protein
LIVKQSVFLFFILFIFCGNIFADYYDQPQISIEGSSLRYEGVINAEGFIKIKSAIKKAKNDIQWIYINSAGGQIDISMDMGLWVFRNGLNVRVQNVCLSSCANYIFPAGKKKVIEKNAIVAWHGSAIQKNLNSLEIKQIDNALASIDDPAEREKEKNKIIKDYSQYISAMKLKQENFFNKIGVNQDITVIGQSEKYNVKNYWAMSVEDMNKFGIMNVIAPDDYPKSEVSKYSQVTHIKVIE